MRWVETRLGDTMTHIITRRGMLGGLLSALAAPAIVHAGNLMPVRALAFDVRESEAAELIRRLAEKWRVAGVVIQPDPLDIFRTMATAQRPAFDVQLAKTFVERDVDATRDGVLRTPDGLPIHRAAKRGWYDA